MKLVPIYLSASPYAIEGEIRKSTDRSNSTSLLEIQRDLSMGMDLSSTGEVIVRGETVGLFTKYPSISNDAETKGRTDILPTFNHKEYTKTTDLFSPLPSKEGDIGAGQSSRLEVKTIDPLVSQGVNTVLQKESIIRRRLRGKMNERAKNYLRRSSGRKSSLFRPNLNSLIKLLSDILATEVQLEIVQLKYPYHDSNIFAQLLGFKARKLTYGKIKNKIIKKIPVYYSNTRRSSREEGTKSSFVLTRSGSFTGAGAGDKIKKKSVLSSFKFGVEIGGGQDGVTKAKLLGSVDSPSSNSRKSLGNSTLKISKSKVASISSVNKLRVGQKETINLNVHRRKKDKKNQIASVLTGIKVRIAGRLARQRVVPKRTVKTTYKGAVSKSNINLVESATYTGKNKKGAFSIRVWLSHGINN